MITLQSSRMSSAQRTSRGFRGGFTMIEIMIVVMLLGILAAIAIPSFSNVSQETRTKALMSQLKTVRSQLSLYKAQHGDTIQLHLSAARLERQPAEVLLQGVERGFRIADAP